MEPFPGAAGSLQLTIGRRGLQMKTNLEQEYKVDYHTDDAYAASSYAYA